MRVIVAPDCFGGTLTAVAAARAMVEGWSRTAPRDVLVQVPVSDGGPGFLDVLVAAGLGDVVSVTVSDPFGRPVPAGILMSGRTAYVESAQAAGLHLLTPQERNPLRASSAGVGTLVRAALDAGADRIVVGLGGTAVNDGGAGLLSALGLGGPPAGSTRKPRSDRPGSAVARRDVHRSYRRRQPAARFARRVSGVRPAEGSEPGRRAAARRSARPVGGRVAPRSGRRRRRPARRRGGWWTGAALYALGATRRSGIELVLDAVGPTDQVAGSDLVITGEGSYDAQSLRGKAVSGVARTAADQGLPCLVLAGTVEVGVREAAAHGVDAAYATADLAGSAEASQARASFG